MGKLLNNKRGRAYENFLEKDFKEVAKKWGVDVQDLKDYFYEFWFIIKRRIGDPRMPSVYVPWFGTFGPTIGRFNWLIRMSIYSIRKKGRDPGPFWERLKRLWPIRARMIQEKYGLEESTWKLWRDKGPIGKKYLEKQEDEKKEE